MAYESNSIFWVEVEKIVPNPFQPRREFDQSKLKELSESIRMYGVLQPLVVTRKEVQLPDGAFRTEYELIAGERRLRASKLAGLTQVPVIIRSGEETELMKLELAIIENLQREDLNPVDRAMAFSQLANAFGLSHSEVARKVGRSREYVSNSIRLLQLPDTILSALSQREISDGHARTLLMLNDRPEEQDVVFREILLKKLSVREVEKISRKIATDKVRKKSWGDTDPELIEIEKQFTESLGTRVQISKTDYGGKIVIDYFSPEDLQKLLDMVHAEQQKTAKANLQDVIAATPLVAASNLDAIASPGEVEELSREWETEAQDDSFEKPIETFVSETPIETPVLTTEPQPVAVVPDFELPAEPIVTEAEPSFIPTYHEPVSSEPEASVTHEAHPQMFTEPVAAKTEPLQPQETPPQHVAEEMPPENAPQSKKDTAEDDDSLYSLKYFSL